METTPQLPGAWVTFRLVLVRFFFRFSFSGVFFLWGAEDATKKSNRFTRWSLDDDVPVRSRERLLPATTSPPRRGFFFKIINYPFFSPFSSQWKGSRARESKKKNPFVLFRFVDPRPGTINFCFFFCSEQSSFFFFGNLFLSMSSVEKPSNWLFFFLFRSSFAVYPQRPTRNAVPTGSRLLYGNSRSASRFLIFDFGEKKNTHAHTLRKLPSLACFLW